MYLNYVTTLLCVIVTRQLQQPSPDYVLQGHSKIVERRNLNTGAEVRQDSSELEA
jgi:hypothetical protein